MQDWYRKTMDDFFEVEANKVVPVRSEGSATNHVQKWKWIWFSVTTVFICIRAQSMFRAEKMADGEIWAIYAACQIWKSRSTLIKSDYTPCSFKKLRVLSYKGAGQGIAGHDSALRSKNARASSGPIVKRCSSRGRQTGASCASCQRQPR